MTAIVVFAWLVAVVRCLWFRFTYADRLVNAMVLGNTVAGTFLVPVVRHLLTDPVAYQLRDMLAVFALVPLQRLLAFWLDRPVRPSVDLLMAAGFALGLAMAGAAAWHHHLRLDQEVGWTVLAYFLVLAVPHCWMWFRMWSAAMSTMRDGSSRLEVAAGLAMCSVVIPGVAVIVEYLMGAYRQVHGGHGWSQYRTYTADFVFLAAAFATVPVIAELVRQFGLDHWSRRRRQLLPLWQSLTEACPDVVLRADSLRTENPARYLAHRTAVEIHDCIVILNCYIEPRSPATEAAIAAAGANAATLGRAVDIARATSAKQRGDAPQGDSALHHSTARDLRADLDELLALARVWPRACVIAADRSVGVMGDTRYSDTG